MRSVQRLLHARKLRFRTPHKADVANIAQRHLVIFRDSLLTAALSAVSERVVG